MFFDIPRYPDAFQMILAWKKISIMMGGPYMAPPPGEPEPEVS